MIRFLFLFYLVSACQSDTVYFSEKFDSKNSLDKWVQSTFNGDKQGEFKLSAGSSPVDAEDLGIITTTDARFYGFSTKLSNPINTSGKTLVIQYTVKYDKPVDCSGGYIKVTGCDLDQSKFNGETPYKIMFGPDICGTSTRKVHVIFNYNGENYLIKKEIRPKDDLKTHLYTLIIKPDNTYAVKIDNEQVEQGSLEDDWDMLPPKEIDDPNVKKPADWVDEPEIDDPEDKKPAEWDQPQKIPDEGAKKPEDWDDEMDGVWERPQIENPKYKGEWSPKRISNPKYKGPWAPPRIANPEYKPNPNLYVQNDICHVGFDLWQVASNSIFDNIFISDSIDLADQDAKNSWKKQFDAQEIQEKLKAEEEKSKDGDDKKPTDDDSDDKTDDAEDHDEL